MQAGCITLFLLLASSSASPPDHVDGSVEVLTYHGTSDASAAVAVADGMFVVADDENNILRVYRTNQHSGPVFSYDLTSFLRIDPKYPEADIEGATRVGDRIYWVTSHGRGVDGTERPNRYRFFAAKSKLQDGGIALDPIGTPCQTLVHELINSKPTGHLRLDRATHLGTKKLKKKERKKLAPKEDGLNIEALSASLDGKILYIGFRNPRPRNEMTSRREALVVVLNNPIEVVEKGAPPRFGEPMLWDLNGLGIRSMEYSHFHGVYFIVAGRHNAKHRFSLYRWSGDKTEPPVFVRQILPDDRDLNPEAMVLFEDSSKMLLLSDDGAVRVPVSDASECVKGQLRDKQYCLNKHLIDNGKKCFRGIWLEP
ncbi:MAG: DUF3616 domain-containing protein [Phycisphaerales bacterium]|nr:MAG: DUF3616 domain-containing protein [Phycisphaerales bacterium]